MKITRILKEYQVPDTPYPDAATYDSFRAMTPARVSCLLKESGWIEWASRKGAHAIWVPLDQASEEDPSPAVLLIESPEDERYSRCMAHCLNVMAAREETPPDELMSRALKDA